MLGFRQPLGGGVLCAHIELGHLRPRRHVTAENERTLWRVAATLRRVCATRR